MSESKGQALAVSVRLKPSDSSVHPRATNYTNVAVVQGIAHVDFWFIETVLLAAMKNLPDDCQEFLSARSERFSGL